MAERYCEMCGEEIEGKAGTRGPPKLMHKECRTVYNDHDRYERSINAALRRCKTAEGRRILATELRGQLQAIRNSDLTPVIRGTRSGKPDPRPRKRASPKKTK